MIFMKIDICIPTVTRPPFTHQTLYKISIVGALSEMLKSMSTVAQCPTKYHSTGYSTQLSIASFLALARVPLK